MGDEYETVWSGRDALTESLDRDYADMYGDGWDLIWEPTSPLTTPWWKWAAFHQPDPEQFVQTVFTKKPRYRRLAPRILKDWTGEFTGAIAQRGSHR